MNKQLLIVLLAVCLVSAHAFVKRDVAIPTAEEVTAQLAITQKNIEELFKKIKDEADKNLNPDAIKENLNNLANAINKVAQSFTPTTEAPKPAA